MKEPTVPHVTLAGDLAGDYLVDEQLPDGRLVIRPDTSAAAMRRRMGGEPITGEEFNRLVADSGVLPPDNEG